MSAPLTVRNLTAIPLDLKVVERFAVPELFQPTGFGHITHNFTSLVSNVTGNTTTNHTAPPPFRPLAENAQSFAREDVNAHIDPFSQQDTGIKTSERGPGEILRLTFECDGQQYRIDTPTPSHESQELVPLTGGDKRFTGVFLPNMSFLAIYSSSNLNCWMQHLHDNTPLPALSIPGTHNSPTYHKALPSVRCQAVSPREQLDNGVRFFDIRVQPESPDNVSNDTLILVHGVFPISLTGPKHFRKLVDDIRAFLAQNPSETLIMSIKREGTGAATDQHLSRIFAEHYTNDAQWWTAPTVPSLGEARGKIVLLRRFCIDDSLRGANGGLGYGIDAENWAYNTPVDTHGAVCVQDFCEVLETVNIEDKIKYCCEHFERAGSSTCAVPKQGEVVAQDAPKGPLFLNFLSASNFWRVGCWPEKIAAKLNPRVVEHLCARHDVGGGGEGRGDGGVGVVVCDWVGASGDWDLVRCIVGMNAKLMAMEGQ